MRGHRSFCRRSSSRSRTCIPASSRCSRRTSPARRPRPRRGAQAERDRREARLLPVPGSLQVGLRIPLGRSVLVPGFRRRVSGAPASPAGRLGPPTGTGISVTVAGVRQVEDHLARALGRGAREHAALEEFADLVVAEGASVGTPARARTGSPRATRSSRSRACPRSPAGRSAGSRRAGSGRSRPRRRSG